MTLNLPNALFSVIFLAASVVYLTVIAVREGTFSQARLPEAALPAPPPSPQASTAAKNFPPHQQSLIFSENTDAQDAALRAARETARRYAATSEDFRTTPAPKAKQAASNTSDRLAGIVPRPKPGAKPTTSLSSLDTEWENNAVASINPAPDRITTPQTATLTEPVNRQASNRPPRQTWIWKLAHQDYCDRNPSDCGRFEAAPLINWQEQKTLIDATWHTVYESFWPTEDVGGDTWGIGQDCEDYALKLRSELARAGIPRYHLLMATGRALDNSQKLHAVLIIRTDEGWKVADSLYENILDKPSADRTFDCQYMEDPDRGVWASCAETGTPVYAGF